MEGTRWQFGGGVTTITTATANSVPETVAAAAAELASCLPAGQLPF